jgi:hypothetical protein
VATWAGTVTEYDILGRVERQSVPTEIDSSWDPTGDDSEFLWNGRQYDWKGRPLKIIPTDSDGNDGKETLISYEGCGCAGGVETTVQGPSVPTDYDPGTSARRKQKSWEDILGRTWKTQTFKWDGTTEYLTTEIAFNGRDQAITIEQTDEDASLTQTSTMSYDGFGRLYQSHKPEQFVGETLKYTTYSYNRDGSISTVTDGRGAVTAYTYENASGVPKRPLVTGIGWTVPGGSGITDPSDVSFTYDNAGNRTQMTDGMGQVDYEYNSLSELTAETRDFSDTMVSSPISGGKFKLVYNYQLNGQLKSLKDPYGDQINYGYDLSGRLSAVTGSSYGGLTNYADAAAYRAWGVSRSLDYGNGLEMTQTFNNRLQSATFNLQGNSKVMMQKEFNYYNDGSLKYIEDLQNPKLDRLNIYDHVGRINEAKSGAEARGGTAATPLTTNLPYRQTYQYDAFNHLRERTNVNWGYDSFSGRDFDLNYNIVNNQVVGFSNYQWTYDADGRNTHGDFPDDYADYTYNAAGKLEKMYVSGSSFTERYFDGDGRELKSSVSATNWPSANPSDKETKYYIRSTILGGKVVSEANKDGKKLKTSVYAAGTIIARQLAMYESNGDLHVAYVEFEHEDASRMTYKRTDQSLDAMATGVAASAEFDPLGNNIGVEDQYYVDPPDNDYPLRQYRASDMNTMFVGGQRITCTQDGMAIACASALRNINNGGSYLSSVSFLNLGALALIGGSRFWNPNSGRSNPDQPDTAPDGTPRINASTDGGTWEYFSFGWGVSTEPPAPTPPPDYGKLWSAFDFCANEMFGVETVSKSNDRFDFKGNVWNTDDFTFKREFSIGISSLTFSSKQMIDENGQSLGFTFRGKFETGDIKTGIYSNSGTMFGKTLTYQSNTVFVASDADRFPSGTAGKNYEGVGLGIPMSIHVTVHEVGNALATITDKLGILPDDYVDPKTGKAVPGVYKDDHDEGQAFENCVLKNYKSLLAGRKMVLAK